MRKPCRRRNYFWKGYRVRKAEKVPPSAVAHTHESFFDAAATATLARLDAAVRAFAEAAERLAVSRLVNDLDVLRTERLRVCAELHQHAADAHTLLAPALERAFTARRSVALNTF